MKKTSANAIRAVFSGSLNRQLVIVLVVLFGAYSFLIARTVIAINQRKSLYGTIRTEQAKVSALEISYFNLSANVGTDKIGELGFVDSQTPDFAYVQPEGQDKVALVR